MLAADYILDVFAPETIQELGEWNPNSINAETVTAYCRELVTSRQAITIASCIVRAKLTVSAKRLVLDLLKDLDLSEKTGLDTKWLDDRNASVDLGSAVAAAASEPVIARAVLSVILPLLSSSKKAQQASLCYLALVRSSSLGTPAAMNEIQTVFAGLSGLANAGGSRMAFEDLLRQGDSLNGNDDRLVKSAGLSLHNIKDPLSYHAQVVDFAGRLAKDRPDNRTYIYVRHAADYLSSYAKSKSKSLQRRGR